MAFILRPIIWFVLLISLNGKICNGIQFFLEARTRRCFREDVPLKTNAIFTYTIAQGEGTMPVTVKVTNALEHKIAERQEADHGVLTFQTPERFPNAQEGTNWALRDDDKQDDSDRLFRQFPDAIGDDRLPYFFCFEHPRSLRLGLSMRESPIKRRIIFEVKYGAQSHTQQFYDDLAKEKHLSNTEELFRVVEDRVTEIVRLVDEMRQRERRMSKVTERTSQAVANYSALACFAIIFGGIYTSYCVIRFLRKDKIGGAVTPLTRKR